MKICKHINCTNPVFGGGYCKFHQRYRVDKKPKKINQSSPKRTKQNTQYTSTRKKFINEKRDGKDWFCFFCGRPFRFEDNPDVHHLRKRNDELLNDTEWWVLAHTDCHVNQFHSTALSDLKNLIWYDSFMNRLKIKDSETYEKLKNKE